MLYRLFLCALLGMIWKPSPSQQLSHAAEGPPGKGAVMAPAPVEVSVPSLPLATLKKGNWARFDGQQASGRLQELEISIQLTVVEITDKYALIERHTENKSAKGILEDQKTIWNSWEEGRDFLQFDLRREYAAMSLFVDPGYEPLPDTGNQAPRNIDLSEAKEIKAANKTLHAAGKDWETAHYQFKMPFKPPAPPNGEIAPRPPRPTPEIFMGYEEWRREDAPFGLVRAKCEMMGMPLYDMTLSDYGEAVRNSVEQES